MFSYTDGGVLQNQPLGMAKNLVDKIDNHLNTESRFYLFVSPHGKNTSADPSFREANSDYFRLIKRLLSAIIGQAEFQDWITAEDLNTQIALLDARALGLAAAISNGEIDVHALQTTADDLLKLLFTQPLGFLRLAHAHPSVLRLPGVDRVLRYSVLPPHIFRAPPPFHLLQGPDHLRFTVFAHRHLSSPFLRPKSYPLLDGFRGSCHN